MFEAVVFGKVTDCAGALFLKSKVGLVVIQGIGAVIEVENLFDEDAVASRHFEKWEHHGDIGCFRIETSLEHQILLFDLFEESCIEGA